jgi:glycine betaine/proline transport system substrate-binding protein
MKAVRILFISLLMLALFATGALAAPTVKFGVPAWPGVTVKSEVACRILQAMGYKTEQVVASPAIILQSMALSELDAYLGGWTPVEDPMLDPLIKKGAIEKVVANIEEAKVGLVVPQDVYEKGVHTAEDLNAHKKRFGGKIYGIGEGSGINDEIEKAIKQNAAGLGAWELVPSSTSAMLAQAGDMMKNGDWVVFVGWEPHWMNIAYDLKYLDSKTPGTSEIAGKTSIVYTVTTADFHAAYPQAYVFLKQFVVPSKVQSDWIFSNKRDGLSPEETAAEWIASNREQVAKWLKGVQTIDGRPALDALYAQ